MNFEQTQTIEMTKDEKLAKLKDKAAELFSKKSDLLNNVDGKASVNDPILDSYQKDLDGTLDEIAVLEAEGIIEEKQKSDLESEVDKKPEQPMTELEADIFYTENILRKLPINTLDKLNDLKQKVAEEQQVIDDLSKLEKTEENSTRIKAAEALIKQYDAMIAPAEGPIKALQALKNTSKLNEAKDAGIKA